MKMNAHFNLEFRSLFNGICLTPFGIHYDKVCNLCLLLPILQCIGIHLEALLPVFLSWIAFLCLLYRILMNQKLLVHIHHSLGGALIQHNALIQKNNTVTILGNTSQIVAYKKDRLSLFLEFLELMVAFGLKKYVSYGKSLIYYQNFRINIDCHSKRKAHKHTAGIGLYRLMDKISDICKA